MDSRAQPAPALLRAMPSRLINQAALAANRITERALADTGSRRNHFALLAALDEFGPASQADLGRCVTLDRSDVVVAIDTLVENGFVVRSPDPKDGRRNVVTITSTGASHLKLLSTLLRDAQHELLRALSETEGQQLVLLLSRIIEDQ